MQKIYIKNFGAIKEAEIDIKNLLVLIGEQASGKSTVAKLIYFFKSLRDDLFNQLYTDTLKLYFDPVSDLIFPIRQKFYDFFGSTFHLPDFEIRFYYSEEKDKYIRLSLDNRKKLVPYFSSNFLSNSFKTSVGHVKKLLQEYNSTDIQQHLANEQNKFKVAQKLSLLINELFECNLNNQLYIIEGRNSTISYSSLFENYFFADLQSRLLEQSKLTEDSRLAKNADEKTMNEILMLDFVKRVTKIKDIFKKFGNFEGLIESYLDNDEDKEKLKLIEFKIEEILKGKYIIDNWGEKIVVNKETGEYVYLSNASSGQKESIRILQDIFLVILENQKVLRIIEEPEAHLFPVAQKQTVELLLLMLNYNPANQLIITTHSPYILTVINNLLFAKRVVDKNPDVQKEVEEIIPHQFHFDSNLFSAYSIGNTLIGEVYCENIFNEKTGLIKQSYLDTVSDMLSSDFDNLYSIHAQKFAKR
jgi:hypothetical protein